MSKQLYYAVVAVTIDGYIARYPGHKSKWTSYEDKVHLHKMEKKADVLLLSRRSFEIAKKQLSKKNSLVLSRKVNGVEKKGKLLTYINPQKANLKKFIEKSNYKKICVLGGRGAYSYCLSKGLLDEIYMTVEPVAFGEGIGMFNTKVKDAKFKLFSSKKLNKKGTILLHYKKKA